jgi:hypothetical protein
MKSRLAVFTVVVAAAVLLLGGVCGRRLYPPEFISVPSGVYAGDTAWVRLATSGRGYDSVRYVVNWDDATTDTTAPFGLSDTATVWHAWTTPETKYVRAAVYALDDPQGIRRAAPESVVVEAGGLHAPVVDSVLAPPIAVRGETTRFIVYAHDPDGDSIGAVIAWGDSTDTATVTSFLPSPSSISVPHVFTQVETAAVLVSVQDKNGATSLPETVYVLVGYLERAGGNPCRPTRSQSPWHRPSSTIPADDNIIAPATGNPGGPLAPWLKRQRDLYNTGFVGGGR